MAWWVSLPLVTAFPFAVPDICASKLTCFEKVEMASQKTENLSQWIEFASSDSWFPRSVDCGPTCSTGPTIEAQVHGMLAESKRQLKATRRHPSVNVSGFKWLELFSVTERCRCF